MLVHGFSNASKSSSLHTAVKELICWNLVKSLPKTYRISTFRIILLENYKAVILVLFLFRYFETWVKMFDEFFDALVVSTWYQLVYIQICTSLWTFQPSGIAWGLKSCGRRGRIMGELGQMRFKDLLAILKIASLTLMIFPPSLAIFNRTLLVIDIVSVNWRFEIVNRYLSVIAKMEAKLGIVELLSLRVQFFVL